VFALFGAFACSKAEPIDGCPQGSVRSNGQCLVACSGPTDCLSSERCDLAIGACVSGGGGGADAGVFSEAGEPQKDAEPNAKDAEEPIDGGFGEAGPAEDFGPGIDVEPIDAGVVGALAAEPSEVDLGALPLGCAPRPATIVGLRNVGMDTLQVFGISATPPDEIGIDATLPRDLFSGERFDVAITYSPFDVGEDVVELRVDHSASGDPLLVRMRGEGLERQRIDAFEQVRPKIDVAFIVDNSSGMATTQNRLVDQLPRFFERLRNEAYDYHIGVTSMDRSAGGGVFIGNPRVIDPSHPNAEAEVARRVQLGVGGAAMVRGLDASRVALTEPRLSNEHAGFLRPDATLLVVYVSIHEDDSSMQVADYVNLIETVKGPMTRELAQANAIARVDLQVGGCTIFATASRFAGVASGSGGATSEVCANDYGPALTSIPANPARPKDRFMLSTPAEPGTLSVFVNGAPPAADAWYYDDTSSSVVFNAIPELGSRIEVHYTAACPP
jgi:hypothetical protein